MSQMLSVNRPDKEIIEKYRQFNTCCISDALDKIGIKSGVSGILPQPGMKKIVGPAITMRITASGETKATSHGGADALRIAEEGDIIVIDNNGRQDENCWGEIVTVGAIQKGVEGVVIDGVFRDVDMIKKLDFPVYARGVTPLTARGRVMQESYNTLVRLGHVQVRPGDIVIADENGIVVVPYDRAEEVLKVAEEVNMIEEDIIRQLKEGKNFDEVDRSSGYDKLLEKK